MAAVNQKNKGVLWDDGVDGENTHIVVRRVDMHEVLKTLDVLVNEVTKLIVVSSLVDAVDAAITRARAGHLKLNEEVLSRVVDTYRKVLNS